MNDSDMPPLVERPYEQDSNYAFPSPGRALSPNLPRHGTPWPPTQAPSFASADMAGFPANAAFMGSPGQWAVPAHPAAGYFFHPPYAAHPAQGWPGMTPGVGANNNSLPPPSSPARSYTRENDEWVAIERDPEDQEWGGWPNDSFPIGLNRPRSELSRAPSSSRPRSRSPFSSSNSSPLSRADSFTRRRTRSRSFTRPVLESEKRPPREWRPDFSMVRPSGLTQTLGSIFNSPRRTNTMTRREAALFTKITLHPYLRHTSDAQMFLDLRKNPSTVLFRALGREINPWDLTRFACEPPLPHMRLYSPHYPWYIEVESTNPSGVTLHELFAAIWTSMMTPISHADYFNNEMDDDVRDQIAKAWAARCGENEEQRKSGVRRVDFLTDRVVLSGFAKGRDGMWEMKLAKIE